MKYVIDIDGTICEEVGIGYVEQFKVERLYG